MPVKNSFNYELIRSNYKSCFHQYFSVLSRWKNTNFFTKFWSIRTFYFLSFEELKIITNIGEKIGENRIHRFVVRSDEHITILHFSKVIYPKHSKNWPCSVAHTIDCVFCKMLNHGLNHVLCLLLFKLIPCPIHWILYVL